MIPRCSTEKISEKSSIRFFSRTCIRDGDSHSNQEVLFLHPVAQL